ncbi:MAG: Zn-dependent hydrolase [Amphritea sp.]
MVLFLPYSIDIKGMSKRGSIMNVNSERLLSRLKEFGNVGRDSKERLARIAITDADKLGRDNLVAWMQAADLKVAVDRIGNIHGIWKPDSVTDPEPIMMGSHIDTVLNAGIYDGNYGVLAGLEVILTLQECNFAPSRPIVVSAFSNEEGARYAPDMMGSLVYAGGLSVDEALETVGLDGSVLGSELERIGYAGHNEPGFMQPKAYVELHIEQGPVLENLNIPIGAVENLQGISWQRITITGTANHAGTTPMSMRSDAGIATAKVMIYLRDFVTQKGDCMVSTVGSINFEPNIINVIPSKSEFTVDLRSPNEDDLKDAEMNLNHYLKEIQEIEGVTVSVERLARFEPVTFDKGLVETIEAASNSRGLTSKRMTSGAGHDAQMMARICPSAMIFVPSKDGISHNPKEYTEPEELVAGANVLLDTVRAIAI